jgi:brefeldin A-resistance guanine nucleotide exchange factor 1
VNVLDPNDQQHTDSTRLIALSILNAAIESSGPSISRFPSLESVILDPGCKFLFQLARSENTSVLNLTLRTITTLFETVKTHLKLQQELFLSFTVDRLAPPHGASLKLHQVASCGSGHPLKKKASNISRPSSPAPPIHVPQDLDQPFEKPPPPTPPRLIVTPAARGETRELLLETLAQLSRHPSFLVDLYTNYDCDINCENLFDRLMEFLTRGVYPISGAGLEAQRQQQNSRYLCLDILLGFVNDMAMRAESVSYPHFPTLLLRLISVYLKLKKNTPWPTVRVFFTI